MPPKAHDSSFYRVLIGSALAAALLLGGLALFNQNSRNPPPEPVPPTPTPVPTAPNSVPKGPLTTDLPSALEDPHLTLTFRTNGRERLTVTGVNRHAEPARILIPAQQTFESVENAGSRVLTVRDRLFEIGPGQERAETLPTLALASANRIASRLEEEPCTPVPQPPPEPLQPLLAYLPQHPELPLAAAQTALLCLLENLPTSAFAKFSVAGGAPAMWENSAFKVETADLLRALLLLRELGIPDEQAAITIEPQTRIEAMLDPLSHAMAMRYYGIEPAAEWDYWKHELLEGDPATRHYALHGIAKYYPEVALQMLPQWARETRTNRIFRKTALEALAATRQPGAEPILLGLEQELGPETELGKAAAQAAAYLRQTLAGKNADPNSGTLFRLDAP